GSPRARPCRMPSGTFAAAASPTAARRPRDPRGATTTAAPPRAVARGGVKDAVSVLQGSRESRRRLAVGKGRRRDPASAALRALRAAVHHLRACRGGAADGGEEGRTP